MGEQRKILIVEDSQINRIILREILSEEYEVLEAENGEEALEVLKEYGQSVSLIVLDIIMPVMDGYTFLSIIKSMEKYATIPVIVTTQSGGESDEVNALAHGATDFVAKPYKPQVILHRVASIIHLRESAAIINQVQYDHITGLYNKEFFYQKANEILNRNPNKHYNIVCSDVENFKFINDVLGMTTGDRLLKCIADTYLGRMGNRGICGRFNADRFVCLLEWDGDYTDDMFVEAGEHIRETSKIKNISLKWGLYDIHNRSVSIEQMCDRALLAARSIKGQYGKHFARYDDELRSKMLKEQAITDDMETALREEQFEVYLQPKYELDNDGLAGAEALVRWNHPRLGFQSPGEFIPLFERNGFITQLDQYVWDKACAIMKQWEDWGMPPIPISVNVSRADIYNADLDEVLLKILKKYQLKPSRLHLEITESAYTENPKQIIEMVGKLRSQGFVIEMDDFGSGYSSLNMLNEMPIDILKLDMKFIQSETAKPMKQGILQFIVDLAKWMKLKVVAEGVETKDQLECLRGIGCDYVQGYYFAKPMPREEFEAVLKEHYEKKALVVDEAESNGNQNPRFQKKVREALYTFCKIWFEERDVEKTLAFMADDVEFVGTGEREYARGKEAMAEYVKQDILETSEPFQLEIISISEQQITMNTYNFWMELVLKRSSYDWYLRAFFTLIESEGKWLIRSLYFAEPGRNQVEEEHYPRALTTLDKDVSKRKHL